MRHRLMAAIFAVAWAAVPAAPAGAQTAAGTGVAVASPTYITIPLELTVNRPAAEVWAKIGTFCGIRDWLQIPCTILSGTEGELGAVRSIANEIMVAKTDLSYTYTQPVRDGRPFNVYHGTLEAKPLTATTSKLVYTLFYDNSMLADDAAREKDRTSRAAQFQGLLNNMKILAEGGTLPPRQPPATR